MTKIFLAVVGNHALLNVRDTIDQHLKHTGERINYNQSNLNVVVDLLIRKIRIL